LSGSTAVNIEVGKKPEEECLWKMVPTGGTMQSVEILGKSSGEWKKMSLPEFCGGDTPGAFLDMGNEGLTITPIIGSLICWFVVRSSFLLADFCTQWCKKHKGLSSLVTWITKYPKVKTAKDAGVFLLLQLSCSFWIAPVLNMEFHEKCSTLLLTYYSDELQSLSFGCIISAIGLICGMVLRVCCGQGDEEGPKGASGCWCLLDICLLLVTIVIGILVPIFGGIWYRVTKVWWSLFFGYDFNLAWSFPELELGMKLNILHLLILFLWLADGLAMLCSMFCQVPAADDSADNS